MTTLGSSRGNEALILAMNHTHPVRSLLPRKRIEPRYLGCYQLMLLLIALVPAAGAVFSDDFSAAPNQWEIWNAGAVRWDDAAKNVAVTWDSRETNSFFFHKLPFALTRQDSFSVEFTIHLNDVQPGINPNKRSTFPLSLGFINVAEATRSNYFRGSGVNANTGPRSLVEFAYFPDDGFIDATVAPIIASTNNQIAFSHSHPVELTPGETYRINIVFDPTNQVLSTTILHNGLPYGEPPNNTIRPLNYTTNFGDFRVDAFSIHSYSEVGQTPPQFAGSLLAHGTIDDVVIIFPEPPVQEITVTREGTSILIAFGGRARWAYTLERTRDFNIWEEVVVKSGSDGAIVLRDASNLAHAFYRVRADRL